LAYTFLTALPWPRTMSSNICLHFGHVIPKRQSSPPTPNNSSSSNNNNNNNNSNKMPPKKADLSKLRALLKSRRFRDEARLRFRRVGD
jgi:hypothetical protein